jgi:hypothetical protein
MNELANHNDLEQLLLPLKEYFLRNKLYNVYADIYSIDICTLEQHNKQPLSLSR